MYPTSLVTDTTMHVHACIVIIRVSVESFKALIVLVII